MTQMTPFQYFTQPAPGTCRNLGGASPPFPRLHGRTQSQLVNFLSRSISSPCGNNTGFSLFSVAWGEQRPLPPAHTSVASPRDGLVQRGRNRGPGARLSRVPSWVRMGRRDAEDGGKPALRRSTKETLNREGSPMAAGTVYQQAKAAQIASWLKASGGAALFNHAPLLRVTHLADAGHQEGALVWLDRRTF